MWNPYMSAYLAAYVMLLESHLLWVRTAQQQAPVVNQLQPQPVRKDSAPGSREIVRIINGVTRTLRVV